MTAKLFTKLNDICTTQMYYLIYNIYVMYVYLYIID